LGILSLLLSALLPLAQAQTVKQKEKALLSEIQILQTQLNSQQEGDLHIKLSLRYWALAELYGEYLGQISGSSEEGSAQEERYTQQRRSALEAVINWGSQAKQEQGSPELLYFMGSAYMNLDQPQQGMSMIMKFIKRAPQSKYLEQALLLLAEHLFQSGDFPRAAKIYEKILRFKGKLNSYARYKLAWCRFNLQEYKQALQLFSQVAQEGGSALRSEALKDLVMVYSHSGDHNRAQAFFRQIAPKKQRSLLERLASLYAEMGRYGESNFIYMELLKTTINPLKQLDLLLSRAQNFRDLERREAFLEECLKAASLLRSVQERSERHRSLSTQLQGLMERQARIWWSEAEVLKSKAESKAAGRLHRAYLETFPEAPFSLEAKRLLKSAR